MADKTIAQLTAAPGAAAQSGDQLEIQRGAASYHITAGWLVSLARAGLTLAWSAITGTPTTLGGYGITDAASAAALAAHADDATGVHGITDTAALVVTTDARLSDARTPTAHAASHASGGSDALALAISQVTDLTTTLAGKESAGAAAAAVGGHDASPAAHGQTATGRALLTAADGAAARTAIGTDAAGVARPPTAHGHAIGDVAGLQAALDAKLATPGMQALTDAPTVAWNVALGAGATLTLGGSRTLANPTGLQPAGTYLLWVTPGGHSLAYGSIYRWLTADGNPPALPASGTALLSFAYDGAHLWGAAAARGVL